ncbi:uncharacterized protein FOMMEDRAFT_74790 [Fomitiporia mediterranea MF3/22]|uniref:uncharacterized protein n=1 Tax=Fomitiporia mediterranea (strain MF3/22) TaxID=694068 RepID=UPI0004408BC3|nr:uncharacterized protein FOMMEDRAFT_74790 [Fomitiporia mediterranea MF3/22]EJD07746.1 hypothetical protein FOMMEDRAFT_74790 [Fomitiporia mediterranea MF3/22]
MDYDRYDAFLHHIFKQTQGDAWFRPSEDNLSAGVALRIDHGRFRVFPYENLELEPFETAITALNPMVAVKVRSAAVHAVLADVGPEDKSVYVDVNTRIQVIDTMLMLPHAEKEQSAAFIRDERVMVIWSDDLDAIIPTCKDFEDRIIKLLWRSRPAGLSTPSSLPGYRSYAGSIASASVQGGSDVGGLLVSGGHDGSMRARTRESRASSSRPGTGPTPSQSASQTHAPVSGGDLEKGHPAGRGVKLYAPVYNGIAAALSLYFMCAGVSILLQEWALDNEFMRFVLVALIPFLFSVSLFFSLQIVQNCSYAIGPIAQYYENSKYYSAIPPLPNKVVDNNLPHVTIQMPVYKESLTQVLAPSIESIKKAMQTYARQGGTSTIFINDDGLQLLPPGDRDARIAYYTDHNIGWVARPKHEDGPDGFKRAGRFKKASNMNYALRISLRLEKHLAELMEKEKEKAVSGNDSLEDRALALAVEEEFASTGAKWRPWAGNGKAIRMGELVLIVDSDTVVPEDCFRDAARELAACPTVAVIQHESDVMQVAHHYFENGIAYFTRRINKCISMTCANGEVAPFVGHNAFLRWRAIQDASFTDKDGVEKIWSESNVSEDFDMALRLMMRGYIIRWARYSNGGFKEGVSLTADDELNRWQKYAYGCSELLFYPIKDWWRKGPINHQIHRFIWGPAPLHYKLSMLAYMFSYYGIAVSVTISTVNYAILGFQFDVDGYYMHSFEIWLATTIVFLGLGNLAFTLLEYRLGERDLLKAFWTNIKWIPFFFFFFGGLSIHLSVAILAHLFSYNITWSATKKEVERSNFFKEVPKILKRFWLAFGIAIILLGGMAVLSTNIVPIEWRVDSSAWAVIFPLAVVCACHILFPIVLNPYLMVFSY